MLILHIFSNIIKHKIANKTIMEYRTSNSIFHNLIFSNNSTIPGKSFSGLIIFDIFCFHRNVRAMN